MLKILGILGSVVAAVIMTFIMIAAIHANRQALPVVAVVFCALLAFGLFWEV